MKNDKLYFLQKETKERMKENNVLLLTYMYVICSSHHVE